MVHVSGDVERLDAHIPSELKERLRQGDATQKEQVVEALEIYFGEDQSGNRAAIERQIQRYEEQKARGEQMKQDGEDMIREAESGIRRLKARLDSLEQSEASYEDDLDELLEEMEANEMAVWSDHPSAVRIAREHDTTTDTVMADLEERADLNETFFGEGAPEIDETPEFDIDINVGDRG